MLAFFGKGGFILWIIIKERWSFTKNTEEKLT